MNASIIVAIRLLRFAFAVALKTLALGKHISDLQVRIALGSLKKLKSLGFL